jgi:hypothetical protein
MKYLAWTPDTSPDYNIIIEAPNFEFAKKILMTRIKPDTMFQEVRLMELESLITKSYFIEKN